MAISAPKRNAGDPDRFAECEEAIEAELQRLIARAVDVGWDEAEACSAIVSLADNHMLGMMANDEVATRIASADPSGIVLRQR